MVLFIVFLLSKALWVQMDMVGAFQNGTVSIKGKLLFVYHFSLYLNVNYTSVVTNNTGLVSSCLQNRTFARKLYYEQMQFVFYVFLNGTISNNHIVQVLGYCVSENHPGYFSLCAKNPICTYHVVSM